jgi:two-component system, chemotaxis family, sensor kinase CheA
MMEHFRQTFREEADELLAELELSLLELEQNPADEELIDRVFRAMHTLKGSSAMFGFDDIAAFSHEVETVLDLVRDGKTVVTRELIGITLLARDQIKTMLKTTAGDEGAFAAQTEEIAAAFRKLVGAEAPLPLAAGISPGEPSHTAECGGEITCAIRFRPDRDIFKRGINPAQLLNELRELGPCRVTVRTNEIPLLHDLDPELCYLSWDMTLTTTHGLDAVHDVFMFIGEESSVVIEVIPAGAGTGAGPDAGGGSLPGTPPEMPRLGTVGVREGHGAEAISSLRVAATKLDQLVNLVGELVTVQARFSQTAASANDPQLVILAEELERLTEGLRDTALNIRMIPIGSSFSKVRRLVYDLAIELGKEVTLVTDGSETELDKTVIEKLMDPLVHLIRNCIDHGIEAPQIRLAAGKPQCGTVQLAAVHSGDSVLISIRDDGAGIDREAVRARGVQKGLISAAAELSDRELLNLILVPGFSTSTEVTNLSGRGVGLDVVKGAVESLRGSISINSVRGEGTTITIKLPLTLAIIESLLVRVGTDCFVLPLSLVEECIELTRSDVARAHGRHLVTIRDRIVPYIRLRDRFGVFSATPDIEQIVITEVEGKRVGFVVDHVIGGHQTVIKSLGKVFRDVAGVSGATILGDGTVALILDIPQLLHAEELAA